MKLCSGGGGYCFAYKHNNQFINDKLFFETEKYIVCLDGVILNKSSLSQNGTWKETVIKWIDEKECFPKLLRGSFNGFIFYKADKRITVFTDHLGERGVFYSNCADAVVISSNFNMISNVYTQNGMKRKLCTNAVKYMLTFGYMIEDCTYVETIKRLDLGTLAHWDLQNNNISFECYHKFSNRDTTSDSEEVMIQKLDKLFRNAITMGLEKDKEYDKRSLVDLSGGLDCRVINYVAKSMGYTNISNVTFSQFESNEFKVTMKLYQDLGYDLVYFPLNHANYLTNLEEIVKSNYGLSLYSATTGVNNIVHNLNFEYFGLEHGGLLGDIHDGAFPGEKYYKHQPASFEKGMRLSRVIPDSYLDSSILENYENNEMFTLLCRGIRAGFSTLLIRHNTMESASPYADVDFYDYFLSIPLEKRVKGKILQKWVKKCYPDAFKIVEDKSMCRVDANKAMLSLRIFCLKVLFKLRQYLHIANKNNMNPLDHWYKNNLVIKNFMDNYYLDNLKLLEQYPELTEMVKMLYQRGNARDKSMALTALAAVKMYVDE